MFMCITGCFTCCMESGVRVYNVDPLVEKAHFGKFVVIRYLDMNYECFINSSTHGKTVQISYCAKEHYVWNH